MSCQAHPSSSPAATRLTVARSLGCVLALSQAASSQAVAQAAAVQQTLAEDRPIEAATGLLGDLGFYSDYVARGLSYTRERYSVQGHLEYDSAPGVYGGAYLIHNS